MASFTLGTASQATGCAKSTILRAIRAGSLSANRDHHTKEWGIDPAELFRIPGARHSRASPQRRPLNATKRTRQPTSSSPSCGP